MKPKTYNPQQLLASLLEVERILVRALKLHCPDQRIYISEDIDKAIEDFLQLRDLNESVVNYLPTQLALLYLYRETEKTIALVVESNNLRAYHDFGRHLEKLKAVNQDRKSKVRLWEMLFLILLGGLIGGVMMYLFLAK